MSSTNRSVPDPSAMAHDDLREIAQHWTAKLAATGVSRRTVLVVGATGASAVTLAACTRAPGPTSVPASTSKSTKSAAAASSSASGSRAVLAPLSSVAVGSAVSVEDKSGKPILISRTSDTAVVAFSAICPHQGCTVGAQFACPCHGSTFDPKTGAHVSGPAPTGLTSVPVEISGTDIVAG